VNKLYVINLRWVKTPMNAEVIDQTLNPFGDWLRFNASTWLLDTSSPISSVREAIRALLQAEDSILIIKADPTEFEGWAAPWIWEWIRSKRPTLGSLGMLR
jgi:hypothetical protein